MAQGKFGERIIKLRCVTCKEINYHTKKNKKLVERKIELKKYCNRCRKHQVHKEIKK